MAQFCTSCGKPVEEGSPFCTACGARQAASGPQANAPPTQGTAVSVTPAPQARAPQKGSPVVKIVVAVLGVFALITVLAMGSCFYIAYRLRNKAKQLASLSTAGETSSNPASTAGNGQPDIADAMDKLGDSLQKPASSFHISLKESGSDGTSSSLEADVSPDSIQGQETNTTPKSNVDGMAVGGTQSHPINATGPGTPEWTDTVGQVELPFFNTTMNGIRDASAAQKYVGEEKVGGYDARRYDFDLSNAPTSAKMGTLLGAKWLGGMMKGAMGGKGSLLKDYNVKGSAWVSKDDGRMVKFSYDYISMFENGTKSVTHYEGALTKK